jgi:DMSO/TMAO reductase YedYZ molybdopterin-dependent catalytic subunit
MRLPNTAHESRPWRIREIAPDFTVLDVWALPMHGGAEDFQAALELMASSDPANMGSLPVRVLWRVRDRLGGWLGLGRISARIDSGRDGAASNLAIPGTNETSLRDRLPDDLRNTASGLQFSSTPFSALYRTEVEFAAELSNQTVHGVLHLAWVDQGEGRYQGQMAVYVKPRGPLGKGYLALIKPFRHWVVYPALLRQLERAWRARVPSQRAIRPGVPDVTLPPGQHLVDGFPRFGAHLSQPAPAVPTDPVIEIGGVVTEAFDLPLATLATLPRRELTADFHCVAGWSATGLRWEGVSFETVYRTFIEPAIPPTRSVTHVVFGGLDGHRSVVTVEDALADEVLIAERLDGRPLDGDHGAPARLVSPHQYGYMSTKHLCRIEVHTSEPKDPPSSPVDRVLLALFGRHPRARVWQEERHPHLPPWSVRPVYRALIAPIAYLSARASREARNPPPPR